MKNLFVHRASVLVGHVPMSMSRTVRIVASLGERVLVRQVSGGWPYFVRMDILHPKPETQTVKPKGLDSLQMGTPGAAAPTPAPVVGDSEGGEHD